MILLVFALSKCDTGFTDTVEEKQKNRKEAKHRSNIKTYYAHQ